MSMLSAMEYRDWMMVAGAVLLVLYRFLHQPKQVG